MPNPNGTVEERKQAAQKWFEGFKQKLELLHIDLNDPANAMRLGTAGMEYAKKDSAEENIEVPADESLSAINEGNELNSSLRQLPHVEYMVNSKTVITGKTVTESVYYVDVDGNYEKESDHDEWLQTQLQDWKDIYADIKPINAFDDAEIMRIYRLAEKGELLLLDKNLGIEKAMQVCVSKDNDPILTDANKKEKPSAMSQEEYQATTQTVPENMLAQEDLEAVRSSAKNLIYVSKMVKKDRTVEKSILLDRAQHADKYLADPEYAAQRQKQIYEAVWNGNSNYMQIANLEESIRANLDDGEKNLSLQELATNGRLTWNNGNRIVFEGSDSEFCEFAIDKIKNMGLVLQLDTDPTGVKEQQTLPNKVDFSLNRNGSIHAKEIAPKLETQFHNSEPGLVREVAPTNELRHFVEALPNYLMQNFELDVRKPEDAARLKGFFKGDGQRIERNVLSELNATPRNYLFSQRWEVETTANDRQGKSECNLDYNYMIRELRREVPDPKMVLQATMLMEAAKTGVLYAIKPLETFDKAKPVYVDVNGNPTDQPTTYRGYKMDQPTTEQLVDTVNANHGEGYVMGNIEFSEMHKGYGRCFGVAAYNAVHIGMGEEHFIEQGMRYYTTPTQDFNEAYQHIRNMYFVGQEIDDPPQYTPVTVTDPEVIQSRTQISQDAMRGLLKGYYSRAMAAELPKSLDNEQNRQKMQQLENLVARDAFPILMCDITTPEEGTVNTKRLEKYLSAVNLPVEKTVYENGSLRQKTVTPPQTEDQRKAFAEAFNERLQEIAHADYSILTKPDGSPLSDKELVERWPKISQVGFPLFVLNGNMEKIAEGNEFVDKQLMEQCREVSRLYSGQYYQCSIRMDCIASPYYPKVEIEQFTQRLANEKYVFESYDQASDPALRVFFGRLDARNQLASDGIENTLRADFNQRFGVVSAGETQCYWLENGIVQTGNYTDLPADKPDLVFYAGPTQRPDLLHAYKLNPETQTITPLPENAPELSNENLAPIKNEKYQSDRSLNVMFYGCAGNLFSGTATKLISQYNNLKIDPKIGFEKIGDFLENRRPSLSEQDFFKNLQKPGQPAPESLLAAEQEKRRQMTVAVSKQTLEFFRISMQDRVPDKAHSDMMGSFGSERDFRDIFFPRGNTPAENNALVEKVFGTYEPNPNSVDPQMDKAMWDTAQRTRLGEALSDNISKLLDKAEQLSNTPTDEEFVEKYTDYLDVTYGLVNNYTSQREMFEREGIHLSKEVSERWAKFAVEKGNILSCVVGCRAEYISSEYYQYGHEEIIRQNSMDELRNFSESLDGNIAFNSMAAGACNYIGYQAQLALNIARDRAVPPDELGHTFSIAGKSLRPDTAYADGIFLAENRKTGEIVAVTIENRDTPPKSGTFDYNVILANPADFSAKDRELAYQIQKVSIQNQYENRQLSADRGLANREEKALRNASFEATYAYLNAMNQRIAHENAPAGETPEARAEHANKLQEYRTKETAALQDLAGKLAIEKALVGKGLTQEDITALANDIGDSAKIDRLKDSYLEAFGKELGNDPVAITKFTMPQLIEKMDKAYVAASEVETRAREEERRRQQPQNVQENPQPQIDNAKAEEQIRNENAEQDVKVEDVRDDGDIKIEDVKEEPGINNLEDAPIMPGNVQPEIIKPIEENNLEEAPLTNAQENEVITNQADAPSIQGEQGPLMGEVQTRQDARPEREEVNDLDDGNIRLDRNIVAHPEEPELNEQGQPLPVPKTNQPEEHSVEWHTLADAFADMKDITDYSKVNFDANSVKAGDTFWPILWQDENHPALKNEGMWALSFSQNLVNSGKNAHDLFQNFTQHREDISKQLSKTMGLGDGKANATPEQMLDLIIGGMDKLNTYMDRRIRSMPDMSLNNLAKPENRDLLQAYVASVTLQQAMANIQNGNPYLMPNYARTQSWNEKKLAGQNARNIIKAVSKTAFKKESFAESVKTAISGKAISEMINQRSKIANDMIAKDKARMPANDPRKNKNLLPKMDFLCKQEEIARLEQMADAKLKNPEFVNQLKALENDPKKMELFNELRKSGKLGDVMKISVQLDNSGKIKDVTVDTARLVNVLNDPEILNRPEPEELVVNAPQQIKQVQNNNQAVEQPKQVQAEPVQKQQIKAVVDSGVKKAMAEQKGINANLYKNYDFGLHNALEKRFEKTVSRLKDQASNEPFSKCDYALEVAYLANGIAIDGRKSIPEYANSSSVNKTHLETGLNMLEGLNPAKNSQENIARMKESLAQNIRTSISRLVDYLDENLKGKDLSATELTKPENQTLLKAGSMLKLLTDAVNAGQVQLPPDAKALMQRATNMSRVMEVLTPKAGTPITSGDGREKFMQTAQDAVHRSALNSYLKDAQSRPGNEKKGISQLVNDRVLNITEYLAWAATRDESGKLTEKINQMTDKEHPNAEAARNFASMANSDMLSKALSVNLKFNQNGEPVKLEYQADQFNALVDEHKDVLEEENDLVLDKDDGIGLNV